MNRFLYAACVITLSCTVFCSRSVAKDSTDPVPPDMRNIVSGLRIPDEGYCDQPYIVVLPNGNWLCTMTTGPGIEGKPGQHVVSTTSTDQGRTWTKLVDIEPSTGPEASWAVPLITPSGRIYAFYNYNGDRINSLNGRSIRADTIGWYCFRYSDDFGNTWSNKRYRLPMRLTACDRNNDWQGDVQLFWGICKPITLRQDVVFSFTKLGKYMLDQGEGWMYRSPNILAEKDVDKIDWELLPNGEHGIRADPFGSIQEEHNLLSLANGRLYCVYRTTQGFPCHTYSSDGGQSWQEPGPMTYAPGGRTIKTPRACPRIWRVSNGKYLFWFHNHGGKNYKDRNPVWVSGGEEVDGRVFWSQPEILLYDDDHEVRISYPDLIEQDGRYWVTETQKSIARIHEVDQQLLEGLWNQKTCQSISENGLIVDTSRSEIDQESTVSLRSFDVSSRGISLDMWIRFNNLSPGHIVLDAQKANGDGLIVRTASNRTLEILFKNGESTTRWDTDPDLLTEARLHHVVINVDPGPKIISTVVDGILCDGGSHRQYGWGRFEGKLPTVFGTVPLYIARTKNGTVEQLRVYDRFLTTSQAVAHFRAGVRSDHTRDNK